MCIRDSGDLGPVPYLDASAVLSEDGRALTLFCVNRSREAMELDLSAAGLEGARLTEHVELRHDDLKATNTAAAPDRVAPRQVPTTGQLRLAPLSHNTLRYAVPAPR